MRTFDQTARRRRGFTLIELLVVLAIISVLVSLAAFGVFHLIGHQQVNDTKSELSRLETELQKEYRAAADKFRQEPIAPSGPMNTAYNYVLQSMANNDRDLARIIWVKLRLKQTFPNNFNEVLNPALSPMPANTNYANQLTLMGFTAANTASPQQWESSVCLLMALGRGEDGAGVKPEDLGLNSFIHSFPTPNGGTVRGLVDGKGNPLAFCRWPCFNPALNPNGQPLSGANNDPTDPSGLLVSTTWQATGGYTLFQQYCHPVPVHTAGKEATTYRLFPLIASVGDDGVLGLDKEPLSSPNPPALGPAPVTYFFGVLPPASNGPTGPYWKDNLYPTLAPPQ